MDLTGFQTHPSFLLIQASTSVELSDYQPTAFATELSAAGLTGVDAPPNAMPFDDGVENLLKFAFNMNLSESDSHTLELGGDTGLPTHEVRTGETGETIFHVEFVRRRGSGLVYSPMRAESLSDEDFVPMSGTVTVTNIDESWERDEIDEICPPRTVRCFSHVEVSWP